MKLPVWNGPAPKPVDASVAAKRLIELANLVPAGRWASYGDLADAYVVRYGENMAARGVASALSLLPAYTHVVEREMADPQARVDDWHVPWHRIRLTDGVAVSRNYGRVGSSDFTNRMFVAEGGTLRGAAATEGCRYNLVETVRRDDPGDSARSVTPARPELSDEQRRRIEERAAERRYRMGG